MADSVLLPHSKVGQHFINLFGDYLWESLESPNVVPARWRTLKHQLRPRVLWEQWNDPTVLVGIRFGHTTRYGMLDLDAGGRYCTPSAIADIRGALETVGLNRTVLVRSSHRGGLHLYIPLPEAIKTFDLACIITQCLKAQGFILEKGHLEVFPNPKTFGVDQFVEYNGHRLPLQPQSGSWLLTDDLEPQGDSLSTFFAQWAWATQGQDLEMLLLSAPHARESRKQESNRRSLSPQAQEWKDDLDIEIREGWTGSGQTNRLLKSIATRSHVFERLSGTALVDRIVELAIRSPGFQEHCHHQNEIRSKARHWARSVEGYYWPIGTRRGQRLPGGENTLRQLDARDRIAQAVAALKDLEFPSIRSLAAAIANAARSSLQTLYRNTDLWHPEKAPVTVADQGVEPTDIDRESLGNAISEAENPCNQTVLQTTGGGMKCGGPEAGFKNSFSPDGGVRGGDFSFPQPTAPKNNHIPIPFDECYAAIQSSVRQLGWSMERLKGFLSEKFDGRSRMAELFDEELFVLLYWLRLERVDAQG
ncbi:hypothetical protein [Phormidium tenue]|uniref:Uncharacterized protein n=1 Tax=Phormidium tenue NIES-30 TaxID=549789 RepID=A0A1U7J1X7_9CYAN|nr:hypothetical protein [Phormidium tenue]MBD2233670.1 hypothetical protein [Phormidium tenue FACHB-1052]OKH46091.1 hypothetical protein NIES30_17470 [Phormidium tenue NIES-30]